MISNFSLFLASPEHLRFQQEYPEVSFSECVLPDRLVINEPYLLVHTIHCWDDIVHHDHDCRLEYGIEKVFYMGKNAKKEQIYEFMNVNDNTCIPIYEGVLQGETIFYFLYKYRDIDSPPLNPI